MCRRNGRDDVPYRWRSSVQFAKNQFRQHQLRVSRGEPGHQAPGVDAKLVVLAAANDRRVSVDSARHALILRPGSEPGGWRPRRRDATRPTGHAPDDRGLDGTRQSGFRTSDSIRMISVGWFVSSAQRRRSPAVAHNRAAVWCSACWAACRDSQDARLAETGFLGACVTTW